MDERLKIVSSKYGRFHTQDIMFGHII